VRISWSELQKRTERRVTKNRAGRPPMAPKEDLSIRLILAPVCGFIAIKFDMSPIKG
jgi:hypothetical protein